MAGRTARLPNEDLYRRSRQIGEVLTKARKKAGRSLREVAEQIGTSRQRYALIEAGQGFIAAVELEVVIRYLDISPEEVLPHDFYESIVGSVQEMTVRSVRGELVRLRLSAVVESE